VLTLSAQLSHALVAFMIEADNEAEHRMPHRTTDRGAGALGTGPWLVSLTMYENCLRYLDHGPLTVAELKRLARTGTNLDGMRRWGYITLTIPPPESGAARQRPGPDAIIELTANGRLARATWQPLPGVIEDRWRDRYGPATVARLRDALQVLAARLDPALPDCLPILGYGLFSRKPDPPPPPSGPPPAALSLNALLSGVLQSLALDFERESDLSLAISVDVLRVLTEAGVRMRDLPQLTGVSSEAIAMAMTVLRSARLAVTEKQGHWRVARLTDGGHEAQRVQLEHLAGCEENLIQLDPAAALVLRDVLAPLAHPARTAAPPPLFAGLEPYPDGWRAKVRPAATLPRYPMVLHRGGYPDGS
jgi:hypothetical protein